MGLIANGTASDDVSDSVYRMNIGTELIDQHIVVPQVHRNQLEQRRQRLNANVCREMKFQQRF